MSPPPKVEERRAFLHPIEARTLTQSGTFEGYLSVYDEVDSYGTYTVKGSFRKTLRDKGPARPMLWHHDVTVPIGVLHAKEDDHGLHVRGELNLETQAGKEAYSLLRQGAVRGLSQGFNITKWEEDKERGAIRMTEVDLWEGSLVTFPSVASALVTDVRHVDEDALTQRVADEVTRRLQEAGEAEARAARAARVERSTRLARQTVKKLTQVEED